jgi:hypothetical protein
LPVPEAPGRLPGGRLHQGAPLVIGLDHQHRADGRERDRLSQLCIAGGHLLPRLRGTGFESLEAERPPQDGLQRGPTRAGCRVGRPLDGSLAEQVGLAADWHAECRIEWTVACRPARGAVMAPQAHRPTDRIVGGRALVMRGQRRAVGAGHRPRRAPRRARDNKPAQQRRTPRQPPPEQGQLHGIGGLHPGLGARYLGDQGWEIVRQVLYKLVCIASHGESPVVSRWVALPDYHPRPDGFQLMALHRYPPLRRPTDFGHTQIDFEKVNLFPGQAVSSIDAI